MKLIQLKISQQFRSLPSNFKIDFLLKKNEPYINEFMPYCIVGRNGSGKSNVLEALSLIFYHLECMHLQNLPRDFVFDEEENPSGFTSDKATIDAYELQYYFPFKSDEIKIVNKHANENVIKTTNAHILIKKSIGGPPIISWVNRNLFQLNQTKILTALEAKDFFPNYVLGYSSGENEILSLPFFKMRFIHFDEYEQALEKQLPYVQPEGRLIYFDNSFSQAVFLTNYLMQQPEILEPIYKTLGIIGIIKFRIIIRLNESRDFSFDFENMSSEQERSGKINLTSQITNVIELLKNCSTCWENIEDILYLDFFIDNETKKSFQANFDNNPIQLFQSFQILLTLNLFDVNYELKKELYESDSLYINETVPLLASDKRIMRFKDLEIKTESNSFEIFSKSLSDGEHQFLHSMGICLLFKNSNSLFLLDEPETHFNPDWRSLFISTLRDCLYRKEDDFLSDILITSHSPFIVSDCYRDNVIIFDKSKTKKSVLKISRPDFNTFGASVNLLTNKIFHKEETISDIANKRLKDVLKDYKSNKITLQDAIKNANQLGDSIEKLIIIDEIKQIEIQKKKKKNVI